MVKQSLKKRLIQTQGITQNTLTSLELILAEYKQDNGKSLENPVVEMATPNGTNNLTEGTNKNESKVKEKVELLVGKTRCGTPLIRVGQPIIGLRCSE